MNIRTPLRVMVAAAVGLGMVGSALAGNAAMSESMKAKVRQLQNAAPYRGYLKAHSSVQHPLGLIGGPLEVQVSQQSGGVFVALPGPRSLDPNVFGTPALPRAFAGTPAIDGVPPTMRRFKDGQFTEFPKPSPFSDDKHTVMTNGKLHMDVVDATATDAAVSKDSVKFEASWQDKAGNTYGARCCKKLAVHGAEYPTFGGVVTNTVMHGSSRIGTALMPTMYSYAAFWGMGEVLKNGKVVDSPRLIHVMLTEYVRTSGYRLAHDSEVTPTRVHLHLMIPPFNPDMAHGVFVKDPVKTGLKLPNGKMLPFWHVMFPALTVRARRVESGWVSFPQQLK